MTPAALLLILLAVPARADHPEYEPRRGLISASGFIIYYNSQGPLSFNTMTQRDLPKNATLLGEVRGQACQYELSVPTELAFRPTSVSGAQGNGSIHRAMDAIRKTHPELSGIYDVKIDLHRIAILGVFQRLCTEILARGFKY